MSEKDIQVLKEKYLKDEILLEDNEALIFLSAYDNLIFLKESSENRLKELKALVNDKSVSDAKKSNYRYEGVNLTTTLDLINKAIEKAKAYLSYEKVSMKEFIDMYYEISKRIC